MKTLTAFIFALLVTFSVPRVSLCNEERTSELRWIRGVTGPAQWSITPADPTTADVIRFSGPTPVASNACWAMVALGQPTLRVDTASHDIELSFRALPPGIVCTAEYDPVCGLEGEFGPLEEGDWLFFSFSPRLSFSISFHVSHFGVKELRSVPEGSVELTWGSQSGVSYTVWSCSDLASGDWVEEATIVCDGLAASWKDSVPVGSAKFYRVQKR